MEFSENIIHIRICVCEAPYSTLEMRVEATEISIWPFIMTARDVSYFRATEKLGKRHLNI